MVSYSGLQILGYATDISIWATLSELWTSFEFSGLIFWFQVHEFEDYGLFACASTSTECSRNILVSLEAVVW